MKKKWFGLCMMLLAGLMVGCTTNQDAPPAEDTLGNVTDDTQIEVSDISSATQIPTKLYYIVSANTQSHTLTLDEIAWITPEETDRLQELNLDADTDFPNGFYIYNETDELVEASFSDMAQCVYLDYENNFEPIETDISDFLQHYEEQFKTNAEIATATPYHIAIEDGEIFYISEQYIP